MSVKPGRASAEDIIARIETVQKRFLEVQQALDTTTDDSKRAELFIELQSIAKEFKTLETVRSHYICRFILGFVDV